MATKLIKKKDWVKTDGPMKVFWLQKLNLETKVDPSFSLSLGFSSLFKPDRCYWGETMLYIKRLKAFKWIHTKLLSWKYL